ncbi:MAG: metallophosphoesterase [Gammaproteobacteria bacterium]|nr:metallophosphoesterase [Gammaproteobacteria bacterium]
MKRRDLVRGIAAATGVFAAAGAVNALVSGVRFPVLQAEPDARARRLHLLDPDIDVVLDHAYIQDAFRRDGALHLVLRAFGPTPAMTVVAASPAVIDVTWRNIPVRAELEAPNVRIADEQGPTPVNRRLSPEFPAGRHRIGYRVPFADEFAFTVIGDSGGGSELAWCLERSAHLGADFMLHTGDFYYSQGDFATLPVVLESSPLPMYATIGNHDFHDGGRLVHRDFVQHIGPRNFAFILGETMVASFDTAASTWPASSGDRGELFDALAARRESYRHLVAMTHRPLHDPGLGPDYRDGRTLSASEVAWVGERLRRLSAKPVLLVGHIHVSVEMVEDGITTYISGDGLASRNLASGRKLARILLGVKRPGEPPRYDWQPLGIPDSAYCHDKNRRTLELMGKPYPSGSFGTGCREPGVGASTS